MTIPVTRAARRTKPEAPRAPGQAHRPHGCKGPGGYWAIGADWAVAVALGALWNDVVAAGPRRMAVVYLLLVAALAVMAALLAAGLRRIIGLITGFLPRLPGSGTLPSPMWRYWAACTVGAFSGSAPGCTA